MRLFRSTVILCAAVATIVLGPFAPAAQAQISDTQPPHLVTISFTPAAIDVTAGAKTVVVTATVTDDLAGVSGPSVQFISPSGGQREPLNFGFLPRVSGTSLNGVYQGTVTIPQFSEGGTWKLAVSISDAVGNNLFLTAQNLASLGLPTDLAVTSVQDTHPPTVTNITINPSTIDVSNGPQSFTFDLTLADDLSGVDFTNDRFVEFRVYFDSPTNRQEQYLSRADFTMISGNTLNGTWRATRSFPRFSEPGVWSVAFVQVVDFAGNQVFYPASQLKTAGLQTTFTVLSSPSDTTPPQITGITFTPTVIDTSAGARSVVVTFSVLDDLAGTDFSANETIGAGVFHGLQFSSPSGRQFRTVCCSSFTRTAGTPLNGTWTGSVFFPQFSEGGTWKATVFGIQDSVHNSKDLTTAQMAAAGFPTDLVIFQPSSVPDGTVGPGGGTASDSVFGSRAAISFPAGALPASTTVAIDVLSTSLGLPTPQGFSGGTLFVNVDLEPPPPMPFSPPGITVTLPFSTFMAPGRRIHLYRLDTATSVLVPAVNVNGGNVVGTVNADGFSATFTGVSHLSTLVGFFPTAVPGDLNGDGVTDCADLAIVKASFGKRRGQSGFDERADVNGNGVVDVSDLAAVSRQLGAGTTCQ